MSFQNDYDKLPEEKKNRVDKWCDDLLALDSETNGTVQNLRREETLDDDSFNDLFSKMTPGDTRENLKNTFEEFCRQYELHGREAEIPSDTLLIRAVDSHAFAVSIADSAGNMPPSPDDEEDFLKPYINKRGERMRIKDEIHLSRRDINVCWATFFEQGEPDFKAHGWGAAGIFDALGKPWLSLAIGCFWFEYPCEKLTPDTPRVPTIADAGINARFHPPAPGAPYGRTRPITPGVYPPLKEVVHKNRLADIAISVEYVAP